MATIGELKNIEMEHEIEWKILYFSSLSDKNYGSYWSPTFSFSNESWSLNIYPCGCYEAPTGYYISLYLRRMSSGPPIKIKYTLGLKTLSGQKDFEIHGEKIFEKVEEGYGSHKFLSRSQLFERKPDLLPADVITVFCSLKLPTSVETLAAKVSDEKYSLCGKIVDADNLSTHQKKDKAVKCADCSAVLTLQDRCDHECQATETDSNTTAAMRYQRKLSFP